MKFRSERNNGYDLSRVDWSVWNEMLERIGGRWRIAMDRTKETFGSEQNNARDSNRAERDV